MGRKYEAPPEGVPGGALAARRRVAVKGRAEPRLGGHGCADSLHTSNVWLEAHAREGVTTLRPMRKCNLRLLFIVGMSHRMTRAKSLAGCGAPFPVSRLLLQADEIVGPTRRHERVALVGLREAAVREGQHRVAPLRSQIEGDRRAFPSSRGIG